MYTLVVVDMQKYFLDKLSDYGRRVTAACQKEINYAIANKAAVVFVEYFDDYGQFNYGKTVKDLTKLVSSYKNKATVKKTSDDGGLEVISAMYKHSYPRVAKVCGVNTDFCVHDTAQSLCRGLGKITIISEACDSSESHEEGIQLLRETPNIKIIKNSKPVLSKLFGI